jgi:hypothetical protein
MNYFPTVKVVDRVHASEDRLGALGPLWTDGGADRGYRSAAARSPEDGLRPLRCTKAHRRGCNGERGARGARFGPHRSSGGGGAESEVAVLGEREARAWREAKRGWERCGGTLGVVLAFYRGRGSIGEGWPGGLTPVLKALTPLKTGEGLRGELREGK